MVPGLEIRVLRLYRTGRGDGRAAITAAINLLRLAVFIGAIVRHPRAAPKPRRRPHPASQTYFADSGAAQPHRSNEPGTHSIVDRFVKPTLPPGTTIFGDQLPSTTPLFDTAEQRCLSARPPPHQHEQTDQNRR